MVKFVAGSSKILPGRLLPIHPIGNISQEESDNVTIAFSSEPCMEILTLATSNKKPNSNFLKQPRTFIGLGTY